ncbi:hypothetical protein EJB05_22944 [Eragrostis curvula]|uniref:Major facilitator superfamily (MFS) profile domain-containing protein n=1 Tax=Eragrostis curvula TaxID=38414 RepID=A0A5J9V5Q3_9POAL|nr:hypothetical protein EJB05_22944 [Eragrostis curvula]
MQAVRSPGQCDTNSQPSNKNIGTGNWRACALILGTELSECLAFAGIARNLVTYLTGVLHESNAGAAAALSTWTGTCFLTPLVGAFLADSCWGRYKTIVVFLSVYTLMITLALSASLPAVVSLAIRRAVAFLGLYLVALGVGGIKPCVSPFGAEQFDDAEPGERDAKASFFNWYYFCVNIGSMLASTVLVWVQDRVSWWLGFGIPAGVMTVALAMFVSNKRLYRIQDQKKDPPRASPLTRACQVAVAAVRKRGVELPAGDYSLLLLHDNNNNKLPSDDDQYSCYKIEHTDEFRFLDKAAVVIVSSSPGAMMMTTEAAAAAAATESPWSLCTVTQVEEAKMLLRLCSVWPTVVFFFAVTTQMSSTFLEQGAAMDNRVGPFAVPPATLSSAEVVAILLCVPALEAVLLPLARRVTGTERGVTLLQRLGVGLALATLTMAYMALLETKRLAAAAAAARVSIVWQAPAYFALGAAEVFTSVGLLEFFYDQAPDAMKSLCTAVSLVAVAAGNYLNSVIIAVVAWATTWIPHDLNQGRLDCFFWMMAALSGVNMLAFVWTSMRYNYRAKS